MYCLTNIKIIEYNETTFYELLQIYDYLELKFENKRLQCTVPLGLHCVTLFVIQKLLITNLSTA